MSAEEPDAPPAAEEGGAEPAEDEAPAPDAAPAEAAEGDAAEAPAEGAVEEGEAAEQPPEQPPEAGDTAPAATADAAEDGKEWAEIAGTGQTDGAVAARAAAEDPGQPAGEGTAEEDAWRAAAAGEAPAGDAPVDLSQMTDDDQGKIAKIQACYRGHRARQEVATKRAEKAEPEPEPEPEPAADPEQAQAAIRIQAMYRGGKARDEVRDIRDAQEPEPITFPAREADLAAAKKIMQRQNRWLVDPNKISSLRLTGGAKGAADGSVAPHAQQCIHERVMRSDDWW